jgi:hypothetical protein
MELTQLLPLLPPPIAAGVLGSEGCKSREDWRLSVGLSPPAPPPPSLFVAVVGVAVALPPPRDLRRAPHGVCSITTPLDPPVVGATTASEPVATTSADGREEASGRAEASVGAGAAEGTTSPAAVESADGAVGGAAAAGAAAGASAIAATCKAGQNRAVPEELRREEEQDGGACFCARPRGGRANGQGGERGCDEVTNTGETTGAKTRARAQWSRSGAMGHRRREQEASGTFVLRQARAPLAATRRVA